MAGQRRPIDYRSFGPKGPPEDSEGVRTWWFQKPDEAAQDISQILHVLTDKQQTRNRQIVRAARLYGNMSDIGPLGLGVSRLSATRPDGNQEKLVYNVVQMCGDTATAKMIKNEPEPQFVPSGGTWKEQRAAKGMTKFMRGIFYENQARKLTAACFRDAYMWGDGLIHVFIDSLTRRVKYERVGCHELIIDEMEGIDGNPRQMHRVRTVDRGVLASYFPKKRGVIEAAPRARPRGNLGGQSGISDLIEVRESWHLPSGPGTNDGRRIVTIAEHALTDFEPWVHPWFPFARFSWCERPFGFWAQGGIEQIQDLQMEINKLLSVVQESFQLAGSFKIMVPIGSKVPTQHFNNNVGIVIEYAGQTPPTYIEPPVVPVQYFTQIQNLEQVAMRQIGVSELSTVSRKPAGLDSGVALREFNDIESDRFQTIGKAWERFHIDLALRTIAMVRKASGSVGRYVVKSLEGKSIYNEIDWSEVGLEDDYFTIQCWPVSLLPQTPAGRLATVQEYMTAGLVTDPRQGRKLLNMPDLEQFETLEDAQQDLITKILENICDNGEYVPPNPFMDLALARRLALEFHARAQIQKLEDDRMRMIEDWISQLDGLTQAATPPAPPPGMPPSNGGPPNGGAPPAAPAPPPPA